MNEVYIQSAWQATTQFKGIAAQSEYGSAYAEKLAVIPKA